MIRRLLCLGVILGMLWTVSACSQEPDPTAETTREITLPTVDEAKTPLELLQEAADKTRGLTAYSVDYGESLDQEKLSLSAAVQLHPDGTLSAETSTQAWSPDGRENAPVFRNYNGKTCYEWVGEEEGTTVRADAPYTLSQVFSDLKLLRERTDLISLFAAHPMTVSPSQDGSLCYQLTDLPREAFAQLLFGDSGASFPTVPEDTFQASITTNPEGLLSRLEFRSTLIQITLTVTPLS